MTDQNETTPELKENDMQRPEYCEALDEDEFPDLPCPGCGATLSGNDSVNGVCQARNLLPKPIPLVEIILQHRDDTPTNTAQEANNVEND